jgi:hypothetical protein
MEKSLKKSAQEKSQKYWFRPVPFWGVFAAYYPANTKGIIATAVLLAVLLKIGIILFYLTSSLTTFAWQFLPWALAIFCIFDLLCFRFGEYPEWWQKREAR